MKKIFQAALAFGMFPLSALADLPQAPTLSSSLCTEVVAPLNPKVWTMYEIKKARVLNRDAKVDPDPSDYPSPFDEANLLPQDKEFNILTSGTFAKNQQGLDKPMGFIMRNARADDEVDSRSGVFYRGGVVVLKDRSAFICNPGFDAMRDHKAHPTGGLLPLILNEKTLDAHCARNGQSVLDFMGGAAVLVHDGKKVCAGYDVPDPCDHDLEIGAIQHFSHGKRFDPHPLTQNFDQFRPTRHLVFAERDGKTFVLWNGSNTGNILDGGARSRTGKQIQDELCAAGFTQVIKFDGGRGFSEMTLNSFARSSLKPFGFLIQGTPAP